MIAHNLRNQQAVIFRILRLFGTTRLRQIQVANAREILSCSAYADYVYRVCFNDEERAIDAATSSLEENLTEINLEFLSLGGKSASSCLIRQETERFQVSMIPSDGTDFGMLRQPFKDRINVPISPISHPDLKSHADPSNTMTLSEIAVKLLQRFGPSSCNVIQPFSDRGQRLLFLSPL